MGLTLVFCLISASYTCFAVFVLRLTLVIGRTVAAKTSIETDALSASKASVETGALSTDESSVETDVLSAADSSNPAGGVRIVATSTAAGPPASTQLVAPLMTKGLEARPEPIADGRGTTHATVFCTPRSEAAAAAGGTAVATEAIEGAPTADASDAGWPEDLG